MKFAVRFQGVIEVTPDEPGVELDSHAVMEEHLDGVMEELFNLGAEDPAIDLELSTGLVLFTVAISAQSPVAAVAQASGLFRTAIHASGGSTPDWPHPESEAWGLRLLDVHSSELGAGQTDEPDATGELIDV